MKVLVACEESQEMSMTAKQIKQLRKYASKRKGEISDICNKAADTIEILSERVEKKLPPVTADPKIGHCKDCKYFEYDSVAIVDGIPLIVAHEICKRWGDGCKTKEDGYCFMFEHRKARHK